MMASPRAPSPSPSPSSAVPVPLLALLLLALLTSSPAQVAAECAAHWPCCVCLTNLCPRSRDPTAAACSNCTSAHLAELTSAECHCAVADVEPYCHTDRWACDAQSNRCVPRPGGGFPSSGDCLADGCGQPAPPPPPPGPPPGPTPGGLWLPPIFASDMVLQAERSSIHGHAVPGAAVTLVASPARAGFPAVVVAGSDGVWTAKLGAQPSHVVPANITVTSGAGSVTLSRVLWGDVILCSGQSNMGIPVSYILNSTAVTAAAQGLGRSVRLLRVASGDGQATSPQSDVTLQLGWTKATPATVFTFSAVCWTFALNLAYQRPGEFGGERALGLVMTEAGGTPIEAWMSAESAAACKGVPATSGGTNSGNVTSGLFNQQIAPFRGMVFKLAVWYQGESNALWYQYPGDAHTDQTYTCRYTQLIKGCAQTAQCIAMLACGAALGVAAFWWGSRAPPHAHAPYAAWVQQNTHNPSCFRTLTAIYPHAVPLFRSFQII